LLILSGVGTLGSGHKEFIESNLKHYQHIPWKFCAFHKNARLFQTGDKIDEVPLEIYDLCKQYGAIIATGHEHSYERTHLLSSFSNQTIASTSNTLRVSPGHSFAFVSGLGGESIRYWKNNLELNPWWAALASLDVGVNYGALLCDLKTSNQGVCFFQDIDGKVWDNFTVTTGNSLKRKRKQRKVLVN
jgi:hypothetical protein